MKIMVTASGGWDGEVQYALIEFSPGSIERLRNMRELLQMVRSKDKNITELECWSIANVTFYTCQDEDLGLTERQLGVLAHNQYIQLPDEFEVPEPKNEEGEGDENEGTVYIPYIPEPEGIVYFTSNDYLHIGMDHFYWTSHEDGTECETYMLRWEVLL